MATNNALVTTSAVDSLIGGFRAHVLGRSLPAPAYVRLDVLDHSVSVHPGGGRRWDLASKLSNLLLWAYTLTEVTAEWWRTNDDRLHVTVYGRTNGGLRLDVYQGGEFSECDSLVRLELDQSEGVSLDELYALVGLLREADEHQGVA